MSKDPFEAAFEEQEESPPESPAAAANIEENQLGVGPSSNEENQQPEDVFSDPNVPSTSTRPPLARTLQLNSNKAKDEDGDDEDEDEQMDVAMGKFPPSGDPDKLAKMQAILSQFTEEQMSRYEAFRRAGFQKSNMKRLLVSITGSQKISVPMTIVVSGIAKMFVGELVETAKIVMSERRETGPIRPCHMREAYRRLKLEGKVPRRSAETLGLREVLRWAIASGLRHLEVASDCLQLIYQMVGTERPHNKNKAVVEDILSLLPYFHCLNISFIPRSLNKIAHNLAKAAV